MRAQLGSRPNAVVRGALPAGLALMLLAACQQGTDQTASQEMAWARSALERNPNLEIVATDATTGVFTIRDRRSGRVEVVKLGELVAAPPSQLVAPAPVTAGNVLQESTAEHDSSAPVGPVPDEPGAPVEGKAALETIEGSAPATARKEYTIERIDGHVTVSGPGLSIVSGGGAPPVAAKDVAGRHRVDPIICEGQRMMQLDDRDIYVEGDAVTVRGGCELFITNSRIAASGTGVVVRDGIVHIVNSHVEGAGASFDVAADARLYLRGSTLQGLSRRDSRAMIQDQGGNQIR